MSVDRFLPAHLSNFLESAQLFISAPVHSISALYHRKSTAIREHRYSPCNNGKLGFK